MATTTPNYTLYLVLLDVSKVFDKVDWRTLLIISSEILEDELHVMKLLTENVKLEVKIKKEIGEEITTDTGIGLPQGECMSALLFIL